MRLKVPAALFAAVTNGVEPPASVAVMSALSVNGVDEGEVEAYPTAVITRVVVALALVVPVFPVAMSKCFVPATVTLNTAVPLFVVSRASSRMSKIPVESGKIAVMLSPFAAAHSTSFSATVTVPGTGIGMGVAVGVGVGVTISTGSLDTLPLSPLATTESGPPPLQGIAGDVDVPCTMNAPDALATAVRISASLPLLAPAMAVTVTDSLG